MADSPRDFNKWVKSVERRLNQAIRSGQSAQAVRLARDVQNIRNEVENIEAGASPAPAAPIELVTQTRLFINAAGRKSGEVSVDFPDVIRDVVGGSITVDRYELWIRDVTNWNGTDQENEPNWTLQSTGAEPSLSYAPLTPNGDYQIRVRAVALGVPGPYSVTVDVTIEADTTPPPIPAALGLTSSGATVTASWNSLAETGDPMPGDFAFTEIAYGYQPAPDEVVATLTMTFLNYIFETPPIPDDENYDGTWYFRHRSVDTSGNRSAWSPQTQIVPKKLVDDASIRFELEEKQRQIDEAKRLMDTGLTEVNEKLIPLEQLSQDNRAALDTLNNTTLPALEGDLTALQGELDGIDLTAINNRLDVAEGDLNTLNNTTLPALERDLASLQGDLDGIDLTVINSRIDEAESDLETLNNTTLPALERDLTALQSELDGIDLTGMNSRLSGAESDLNTLNNTTLPALEHDLTALQGELDGIDLTGMSSRLDEAESDLNTLNNTTLPHLNNTITQGLADLDWREVGAISASNIRVGRYENLLPEDYIWELREEGLDGTPLWEATTGGAAGWTTIPNQLGMPVLIRFNASLHNGSTSRLAFMGPSGKGLRVRPGEEFSLTGTGWVSSGASDELMLEIRYATDDGSYISRSRAGQFPNGSFSHDWTVPNNTSIQRMQIEFTAGRAVSGNAHMGDIRLRPRVTSNLIVDGAVIADKIATNAVESDKIVANAITSEKIAANAVTAREVVAGAIEADHIRSGVISTQHMAIASTENMVVDDEFTNISPPGTNTGGWVIVGASTEEVTVRNSTSLYRVVEFRGGIGTPTGTTINLRYPGTRWRVNPGDKFFVSITLFTNPDLRDAVTSEDLRVWFPVQNRGGGYLGWAGGWNTLQNDWGTGWQTLTGEIEIPNVGSDDLFTMMEIRVTLPPGSSKSQILFANPFMRRMNAGELLVDGSILTRHLTADSINSDHLQTNSVGADQIIANAVDANKIAANAVTAGKIAANAVTAGKINANAVTAREVAANAITADKILANAVTADKIAASAVTANKIGANAVIADKIAANAITTAKIATSAVTANEIAANSVTADKILANAVTADKIAASAVTANKIDANAVDADKIAANAVTTGKIAANAVAAREIAADSIAANHMQANSVGADQVIANSIGAVHVQAQSIGVRQLAVGDFSNLLPYEAIEGLQSNGFDSPLWSGPSEGGSGWGTIPNQLGIPRLLRYTAANKTGTGTSRLSYTPGGRGIPARAGDQFYMSCRGWTSSSSAGEVGVRLRYADGGNNFVAWSGSHYFASSGFNEFVWTVPDNPDVQILNVDFFATSNATGNGHWGEFFFKQRNVGELLVDGAVTARTIAAEAVNAEHITASNSLTAKVASFLTVESNMIAANAVTADKISFGSLNGALITGLQIQTHTNNRGVKLTDAGIRAFNSSGNETFTVDASTGDMTATSGTITGVTIQTGSNISSTGGVLMRADPTYGNILGFDTSGNTTLRLGGARNEFSGSITASDITGSTLTGGEVRTASNWSSSGGAIMRSSGSHGNFVAVDSSGNTTARLGGGRNELAFLNITGALRMGSSTAEGALVPDRSRLRLQGRMPFDDGVARDMFLYGLSPGFQFQSAYGPVNGWSVTYPEPRPNSNSAPIVTATVNDSRRHLSVNTANEKISGFDAIFMPLHAHPNAAETFRCRFISVWRG